MRKGGEKGRGVEERGREGESHQSSSANLRALLILGNLGVFLLIQ